MSSCVQIYILKNMSHPARSPYRRIYNLKVAHPATNHYTLPDKSRSFLDCATSLPCSYSYLFEMLDYSFFKICRRIPWWLSNKSKNEKLQNIFFLDSSIFKFYLPTALFKPQSPRFFRQIRLPPLPSISKRRDARRHSPIKKRNFHRWIQQFFTGHWRNWFFH